MKKLTALIAGSLIIAGVVGSAFEAVASLAPPPVSLSFHVSERSVPSAGGTVTISVHATNSTWCRFSARPQVPRFDLYYPVCGDFTFTHRMVIPPNPTPHIRRFEARFVVSGSSGVVTRNFTVWQRTAPIGIDDFGAVPAYGTYGNDRYGDCSLAAVADLLQTWQALRVRNAGALNPQPFIDVYTKLVGGPSHLQNSLRPSTVLNYWRRYGIGGTHISSWSRVSDFQSKAVLEDELATHGPLYVAFGVPVTDGTSSTSPMWTLRNSPPKTSFGGHAAVMVGYNATGPQFATWGYVQQATWNWWKTWGEEAYIVKVHLGNWAPHTYIPTSISTPVVAMQGTENPNLTEPGVISALVSGISTPTSGTVTFTDNGVPIAGCNPAFVRFEPGLGLVASCTEIFDFATTNTQTLGVIFSGDSTYSGSSASSSNQFLAA